jgi:hypothetical protein
MPLDIQLLYVQKSILNFGKELAGMRKRSDGHDLDIASVRNSRQFAIYSQRIAREFELKDGKTESLDWDESSRAWLRRTTYALVKHCLDEGLLIAFHEHRRLKEPPKGRPSTPSNWFKEGFRQLYLSETQLSRSVRDEFAVQMLYAYGHNVPPVYLNGFLKLAGKRQKVEQKLHAEYTEPGFEGLVGGRRKRLTLANGRAEYIEDRKAKRSSRI